jgi:hypothetical protein
MWVKRINSTLHCVLYYILSNVVDPVITCEYSDVASHINILWLSRCYVMYVVSHINIMWVIKMCYVVSHINILWVIKMLCGVSHQHSVGIKTLCHVCGVTHQHYVGNQDVMWCHTSTFCGFLSEVMWCHTSTFCWCLWLWCYVVGIYQMVCGVTYQHSLGTCWDGMWCHTFIFSRYYQVLCGVTNWYSVDI